MATIPAYRGTASNAQSVSAMALTKKDPKLAAMAAKAERGINTTTAHDAEGNRKTIVTNAFAFRSMLQKRAKRNSDATAIIKLLPDIELSAQILVSSILSPKDMMSMELIYGGPKALVSAEVSSALLNRLKTHFEEDYKIKNLLSEMVREPLFEKGSYPVAVIPENAIDEIINGNLNVSTEELNVHFKEDGIPRNLGILGPHTAPEKPQRLGIVLESHRMWDTASSLNAIDNHVHYKDYDHQISDWSNFSKEEYLIVTDNPNILKVPKINAKTKEETVHTKFKDGKLSRSINSAMESLSTGNKLSDLQVERAIYRSRQHVSETITTIKHQHEISRRSVGNPLIMKLPSESVLPVHVPGNPKQHIGYFVLLDEEGNPISAPDGDQMHPGLKNDTANSVSSNLIKKASMNMGTSGDNFDPLNPVHINFAQQIYSDMVERDLISRIKNGIYSSSVSIAKNEEVYRLMLSRVLAKRYTQLLYIPVEYMTYIAFKYGDDGIGRSMLDDQAMINTLRSVLMFTDVMASIKNSIGRTKVTANIPETDPNPLKTVEHAVDEIVRSRTLGIPLGVSNPADVMEFIQRAGYEWEFTGHKGLPDLKFDFVQTNSSYAKPDTDLTDHLRKSSIMGFGLSPETVDNGFNAEFATTAVANNILLSKRVVMWQDIFTPQLSDLLRKIASNTEDLLEDLKGILEENFKGIYLEISEIEGTHGQSVDEEAKKKLIVAKALKEFLEGFTVSLPRPSSVTLENQVTELKNYADALDVALDAYLTSDMFTETVTGEISNETGTVRAMIKAYFLRKWMAEKNILPELADLVTADENGNPQLNISEEIKRHIEAMTKAGVITLVGLQANKKAADADLLKNGVTVGDNADTDSTSGGDTSSGSDDFGGGFDDGFGDMGADVGGDVNTGEEEVPNDQTDADANATAESKASTDDSGLQNF